jgi:SAM-dependent methyltransferase
VTPASGNRHTGSGSGVHACPACAGLRVRPAPELARRLRVEPADRLVRCRRCRLAWLAGAGSSLEYEVDYFETYRRAGSMQGGVHALPAHLQRRLERMRVFNGGRPGRLLEVGCGFGVFLAAARDAGWHAEGVDVSRCAASYIAERYGIHIEVRDVMTVGLSAGVDAVHLNHTLEHLPEPLGALTRLRGVLRRGGCIWVEVPNELDALFEWLRWALLRRLTPSPSAGNPHLFFFTPRALERMLVRAGFHAVDVTTERRQEDRDSRLPLG